MSRRDRAHRASRMIAAAIIALAAWLVVAVPAFAGWRSPERIATGHTFGVAVDQSTGNLYIGNFREGRLEVYNLAHELIAPSPFGENPPFYAGTAVNPTNHHLYVMESIFKQIDTYDPVTGALVSSPFEVPGAASIRGEVKAALSQIASDAAGNVYVPEPENDQIGVFNENGGAPSGVAATITGLPAHTLSKPTGVAVNSAGDVWVADTGKNRLEEFEPNGNFMKEIESEGVYAVAVDTSGDVFASVFASSGPQVFEYDSTGAQIDDFGLGVLGEDREGEFEELAPNEVAVDDAHHIVYVGDGSKRVVWAFTKLPAVTTEGASNIQETSATLHGTVNPGGEAVTSCVFEYGTTTSYGHAVPCSQTVGSGTGSVSVSSVELVGLETDARYHYRLVVGNASGTAKGADKVFIPTSEGFGIQTLGPNAFSVTVSNSVVSDGTRDAYGRPSLLVANPSDLDTQAGSHPFAMTVNFRLKTTPFSRLTGEQYVKDIAVNLPSGFAGSIVSVPQCPMHDLSDQNVGCPTSSQVGTVTVWVAKEGLEDKAFIAPVYNMVPSDGGTAEISFPVITIAQPVIVKVRTDGDYGLVSMTKNISQEIQFDGLTITLWGVPADPRHDAERFLPLEGAASFGSFIGGRRPGNKKGNLGTEWGEPLSDGAQPGAYLTNPTHCGDAIDATIIADSWTNPGQFNPVNGMPDLSDPKWVTESTPMYPELTGCNKLKFNPSIEVTPDTAKANSPSGYQINLHVAQSTNPNDLATPALDNATATLPQGLVINPGAADGLQACTSDSAEPAGSPGNQIGLGTNAEPACPVASQVGSIELKTPLLPDILYGQIYLSSEHSGSHYGVFVVIRGEGLLIKLHSSVFANPVTGQLTATFLNNPELPFSDFTMHFYGGPRAVFVNPTTCGPATTTTDLMSWASEPGGLADATPSSSFNVSFDGYGAPCPSPQPFAPVFTAGTTSIQAGGFSPLTTTFSRPDEDQLVNHVQVTAPPGLLGTLREVPLCPEPQASEGTCSSASRIGHTIVAVGSGAAPLYLPVPGQPEQPAFVTGPYKGAPFGLTFVVPAVAGPYDLGKVIVRAAINVDPRTAQLTVTSDPLPTIIDGIPVQVKTVNVVIDRHNFVFNPTNCNPMNVDGSVTSLQGSTASLSSSFQVTGCGDLKFQPQFSVSTSGRTSRANGTSLDARLSFPKDALGKDANIASVKVDLPKQLPSRLTTLQKACPARTFEADPAACSKASIVGIAKAVTPTLPDTLMGPVYFVSHGGEEFPNLIIVLQGEGVRVDLTGDTFINEKTGITSSTFKLVPDVPVDSFELFLPQGPNSALAANGNLCRSALKMPASFTAQNGLSIHENIPISVTGCGAKTAKAKKAKTARHKHKARKAGHGHAAATSSGRGHR
jgi:hypothetical protein